VAWSQADATEVLSVSELAKSERDGRQCPLSGGKADMAGAARNVRLRPKADILQRKTQLVVNFIQTALCYVAYHFSKTLEPLGT
jgi:hypothetical protein